MSHDSPCDLCGKTVEITRYDTDTEESIPLCSHTKEDPNKVNDHEAEQRTEPNEGEVWLFSHNGETFTATIYEVSDTNYGRPEIAYRDANDDRSAFKFNGSMDPMPVRRVS